MLFLWLYSFTSSTLLEILEFALKSWKESFFEEERPFFELIESFWSFLGI